MQCTPPPPRASVAPGTATASRPGNSDAISASASSSVSSPRDGDDQPAVADVEVRVRDDARPVLVMEVRQPRQLGHLDPRVAQPAQVLLAVLEVRVRLVEHGLEHGPARRDEGADVVDVPVGVAVLDQPEPEPDDPLGAQLLPQLGLDLLAREPRVAVLLEQALLGRDQRPGAVDADRAALEHEVGGVAARHAELGEHARGELRVLVVGDVLLAPAVEAELDPGAAAVLVADEDRARVARPRVVERQLDDVDAGAAQPPRLRGLARVDGHQHRLEGRDRVGDRRVVGLRLREPSPPQASARAGQHMIVRSCGAHSAGMRTLIAASACGSASAPPGAPPRSGSASGSRRGRSPSPCRWRTPRATAAGCRRGRAR